MREELVIRLPNKAKRRVLLLRNMSNFLDIMVFKVKEIEYLIYEKELDLDLDIRLDCNKSLYE